MRRPRWSLSVPNPAFSKAPAGVSPWMILGVALFTLGQLSPPVAFAASAKSAKWTEGRVEFKPEHRPGGLRGLKKSATMWIRHTGFECTSDGKLRSATTPVVMGAGLTYHNDRRGPLGEIAERLAKARHPVITLDFLGNGASTGHGDFSMKIADQSNALAIAMEKLGIKKGHFVGHSKAGALVLHFAAHHGDVVDTVLPINAAAYGLTLAWKDRLTAVLMAVPVLGALVAGAIGKAKFTKFQESHYHDLDKRDTDAIDANYELFNQPGARGAFSRATRRIVTDIMPGLFATLLPPTARKWFYGDVVNKTWKRDVLERVGRDKEGKVMLLCGRFDKLTPLETAGRPLAEILGTEPVVVDSGHNPSEAAEQVAGHILRVLPTP